MFEQLSDKLTVTFERLRGRPRVTEADLEEALRDVRVALLEADVNFKVVRQLVATVRERALGAKVLESITGAQQVVKIVHDALVEMLGSEATPLVRAERPPTVVVLAGLQGSGKTTTAAKLANLLRKQGRRPLLVAADVHRPAAIDQLVTLGKQLGVPVKALDAIEVFHPDRLAQRILGMGDILTLVERAQETVDQQTAEAQARKLLDASFTFDDFYAQLQQVKKMGPLGDILKMIPGLGGVAKQLPEGPEAERELRRIEAIISSMTRAERGDPTIINGSRRRRIAAGSGTTVSDVNALIKQFGEMKKLMKQMGALAKSGRLPRLPGMPRMPGMPR